MERVNGKNYAQFYADLYDSALQEEHHDEALDAAIKGYVIANDIQDEEGKQVFLTFLKGSIYGLIEKDLDARDKEAEQGYRCVFCGEKADDVKLLVGALGSICQTCAHRAYEHFTQGT